MRDPLDEEAPQMVICSSLAPLDRILLPLADMGRNHLVPELLLIHTVVPSARASVSWKKKNTIQAFDFARQKAVPFFPLPRWTLSTDSLYSTTECALLVLLIGRRRFVSHRSG